MYPLIVALFMFLLPGASVAFGYAGPESLMPLIGKWFVFWAVGERLLTAGVRQYLQPDFTAREIFHMGDEALPIVRELGVANCAVGVAGVVSLWRPDFIVPVALIAAIFYGVAGVRHVFEKGRGRNETIAMVSDLFAAAILGAYIISTLI